MQDYMDYVHKTSISPPNKNIINISSSEQRPKSLADFPTTSTVKNYTTITSQKDTGKLSNSSLGGISNYENNNNNDYASSTNEFRFSQNRLLQQKPDMKKLKDQLNLPRFNMSTSSITQNGLLMNSSSFSMPTTTMKDFHRINRPTKLSKIKPSTTLHHGSRERLITT